MKNIIMLSLFMLWDVSAYASDMMEFKRGVVFNHKLHQSSRVGQCFACHENVSVSKDEKTITKNDPGKIKGFGKEWAHKVCKECHDIFEEGPVDCKGCHNK